jgi:L-alanine-DL-glutamate epimerase-like enolase superfamily enzyme
MTLSAIRMEPLHIPFHAAFRHAGAERAATETVIVRAMNGTQEGVGEGCPRSYVTGESIETALAFFAQHESALLDIDTMDALMRFVDSIAWDIDANPAAWCAVETALLDLIGKIENKPLEALLGLPPIEHPHTYSAVLSAGSPEGFAKQLGMYKAQGFSHYKIKLSGDLALDRAYVQALQMADILPTHVRADANRLWEDAASANAYLSSLAYPFWAIEDPLKAFDTEALGQISTQQNCKIILDEYLSRADQIPAPGPWIINLRVSKMGGILRSLNVLQAAAAKQIPVIVGAQVGETSILTRAGLCVAHAGGTEVLAQEGAFGTILLTSDLCDPPLMFGKGGLLKPPETSAPGLGLAILSGT